MPLPEASAAASLIRAAPCVLLAKLPSFTARVTPERAGLLRQRSDEKEDRTHEALRGCERQVRMKAKGVRENARLASEGVASHGREIAQGMALRIASSVIRVMGMRATARRAPRFMSAAAAVSVAAC